ncbi:6801_t:CDS:2, partial [Scutellospora calospora]
NVKEITKYLISCIFDCNTCWNSSYLAWTRLIQIKAYIELLITDLITHDKAEERKDGKLLKEINLTNSEWDLLKELLQVLDPFEEATRYLGGSYYSTYSFIYAVIEKLKEFFKLTINKLNIENIEDTQDVFDQDEDEQSEFTSYNKINIPVNTVGLLNEVKKKIYMTLCHYYSDYTPQELVSALLDPRLKSLDFINALNRSKVELTLRNLYINEKALENQVHPLR